MPQIPKVSWRRRRRRRCARRYTRCGGAQRSPSPRPPPGVPIYFKRSLSLACCHDPPVTINIARAAQPFFRPSDERRRGRDPADGDGTPPPATARHHEDPVVRVDPRLSIVVVVGERCSRTGHPPARSPRFVFGTGGRPRPPHRCTEDPLTSWSAQQEGQCSDEARSCEVGTSPLYNTPPSLRTSFLGFFWF
jgi:hypothetical protein